MVFDIKYGKMKGRIFFDILDRSIINRKMTTLRVYGKGLSNVYRKIFGTRSYGADARACECISAI